MMTDREKVERELADKYGFSVGSNGYILRNGEWETKEGHGPSRYREGEWEQMIHKEDVANEYDDEQFGREAAPDPIEKLLDDLLYCVGEYQSDVGFNGPIYHYHWRQEEKAKELISDYVERKRRGL